ncbi:hypothetical protein BsWGS_20995 [Bradybaena similaris]
MNNFSTDFQLLFSVQGVINSEQYTITSGSFSVAWVLVSALGLVGNAINIQTFIAMKLEDGVTVSFLVLSLSDECFTLTMFLRGASSIFYTAEMALNYTFWFPVEPYAIYIFFVNFGIVMYVMTVLTTTFLAVARCMCVARPLHFKNAFTRRRCIIILSCFAVFTIVSYLPIYANMGLLYQYDSRINATRPSLWISPNREIIKDVIWAVRDTFLPIITQFIVIVCVIVMANSLRESNKFRQSSRVDRTLSEKDKDAGKLGKKDMQVVKQVAIISCVYIVCNMPKIVFNIAGIIESDLTVDKYLQNMYLVTLSIAEFFQIFNSSINVFIYYKYNSKFKSCCIFGNK